MTRMIFLNLPVADLPAARAFYEAIGFRNDPRFTDDTAACMTVSDTIHVMLLTHDKYRQFTLRPIAGRDVSGSLSCLSADSRDDVDRMVEAARRAGGVADPGPVEDYGFMYGRSFEDPDGHQWGVTWLDLPAFTAAGAAARQPA